MMDEYIRFAEVEVLKSLLADTAIPVLDKILASRSTLDKIKIDNGPPFQSADFADFAQQLPELRNRPQTCVQESKQKDMINNYSKSKMKMKH